MKTENCKTIDQLIYCCSMPAFQRYISDSAAIQCAILSYPQTLINILKSNSNEPSKYDFEIIQQVSKLSIRNDFRSVILKIYGSRV